MCEYCEHVAKEDTCIDIIRKWFIGNHVVDPLNTSHVSTYYLFFYKREKHTENWYLCTNNDMRVEVNFCPWCGRKLIEENKNA